MQQPWEALQRYAETRLSFLFDSQVSSCVLFFVFNLHQSTLQGINSSHNMLVYLLSAVLQHCFIGDMMGSQDHCQPAPVHLLVAGTSLAVANPGDLLLLCHLLGRLLLSCNSLCQGVLNWCFILFFIQILLYWSCNRCCYSSLICKQKY